ncbi:lysophospholipid acyltransferase family protein [Solitalea longa]|uniref:lysophospholipid acyltransferase family protein n=1 Tax=Solitalea longa TaxID=2079460 RepID=UPI0013FD56A3|nr:lysophospholipid acyltransferase family protein [Solitalea longa]
MNKVAYYISLPVLYLIALLPFPVLYLLSDFLKVILFDLIGYRKKVILTNLRNSFPHKSVDEINQIATKFAKNLSDMMLEGVKMLTLTKKQLHERFVITNPELLLNYQNQGRSVIGVVGHMINWEWAGFIQSSSSPFPTIIVYKPLQNDHFDQLVYKMRARFGAVLVAMKSTFRKLTEYKNKPYILVLAGDQYPGKGDTKYKTTFLNQPTYVFLGTERIAQMTNSVVIFCDIRKVARGRYEVTFIPLTENPKETAENEISEMHIKYLEKVIGEQPEIWLWSHRRWK